MPNFGGTILTRMMYRVWTIQSSCLAKCKARISTITSVRMHPFNACVMYPSEEEKLNNWAYVCYLYPVQCTQPGHHQQYNEPHYQQYTAPHFQQYSAPTINIILHHTIDSILHHTINSILHHTTYSMLHQTVDSILHLLTI